MKYILLTTLLLAQLFALSPEAQKTIAKGKALFEGSGCTNCHEREDYHEIRGGPSLKGVTSRRSIAYIRDAIVYPEKDTAKNFKEGMMPKFDFSPEEVTALIIYLGTL